MNTATSTEIEHAPTITFLNYTGDVTITWDKSSEEQIIELIKKKMAQNYTFFIIKPRPMSFLFGDKKVPLRNLNDLRSAKALSVPDELVRAFTLAVKDETLAAAMATGHVEAVPAPSREGASGRLSRDPHEIARSSSIATRPVVGG